MSKELQYIADIDKLIPRPDIALDVLALAHDSTSSIADIARKVEQDPSLTANMLRMANSSYFGHMRQISSVEDIIVRLGLDMLKILAITSASAGLLNSPQKAYNLEPNDLWNHSLASAILASVIGRYAGIENTFAVYTAALLHDIGKVVLNRPLQDACDKSSTQKDFSDIVELEQFMLGTDHAKVGMALLNVWGLPDDITIPVGYHHTQQGEKAGHVHAKIVYLANFLVESLGIHATTKQKKYTFAVDAFLEQNRSLPEVPNFEENMAQIIEEFSIRFSETAGML